MKEQRALDPRVRVMFFTSSLGGGGAEMHLLRVVNHMDRGKFRISIALARAGGQYESALGPDVTKYVLGGRGRVGRVLNLVALRRLLQVEHPDILCSVMDHMNVLAILSVRGLRNAPKVVASVQIPPTIEYRGGWTSRTLLALIRRLYPAADRVVALSHGVAADLRALVAMGEERIDVIYNAGVDTTVREKAREGLAGELVPLDCPLIVACGRLTQQKGFPYLIEAFARVQQTVRAHLLIVGEGEERHHLESKIQQLGLSESVSLVGFQDNPYKFMAAAHVFVLSSLWEGFGNVIVEAMACGAPVIACDCPYGPAEIITDGVNGILVPPRDVNALSEAILRVLTDAPLRSQLSQNGRARANDFEARNVAAAYGGLFLGVLAKEQVGKGKG
jgi:glycosyltransferase involved in cell wall biosynthesis